MFSKYCQRLFLKVNIPQNICVLLHFFLNLVEQRSLKTLSDMLTVCKDYRIKIMSESFFYFEKFKKIELGLFYGTQPRSPCKMIHILNSSTHTKEVGSLNHECLKRPVCHVPISDNFNTCWETLNSPRR